jgi:hypothetical protein
MGNNFENITMQGFCELSIVQQRRKTKVLARSTVMKWISYLGAVLRFLKLNAAKRRAPR